MLAGLEKLDKDDIEKIANFVLEKISKVPKDIYIRERVASVSTNVKVSSTKTVELNYYNFIRIPWLPEEIEVDNGGGKFATYDILDLGEVAVPSGENLTSYSWEGTFPGSRRTDKSMLRGSLKDPNTYHKTINTWKANGTPLQLIVPGTAINADVLLDKYVGKHTGGFGDIDYSISFIEDREITVTTKKVEAPPTKRSETQSSTKNYTIKKGDNLWEIAEKFLGSGSKWETIYNLNKTIIEKTAKERGMKSSNKGWWIFPGVTIAIRK